MIQEISLRGPLWDCCGSGLGIARAGQVQPIKESSLDEFRRQLCGRGVMPTRLSLQAGGLQDLRRLDAQPRVRRV